MYLDQRPGLLHRYHPAPPHLYFPLAKSRQPAFRQQKIPSPRSSGNQPRSSSTTLIARATITVLKRKESIPCINATRRIVRDEISISETWNVIPITNAK